MKIIGRSVADDNNRQCRPSFIFMCVHTCPLANPQRSREQSWLMLSAETAPKSAPVALVPRQSRRAWLVSGQKDEEDIKLLKQQHRV